MKRVFTGFGADVRGTIISERKGCNRPIGYIERMSDLARPVSRSCSLSKIRRTSRVHDSTGIARGANAEATIRRLFRRYGNSRSGGGSDCAIADRRWRGPCSFSALRPITNDQDGHWSSDVCAGMRFDRRIGSAADCQESCVRSASARSRQRQFYLLRPLLGLVADILSSTGCSSGDICR